MSTPEMTQDCPASSAERCKELVAILSESSLQQKYQAAQEIRILTKADANARSQFGQGGAIPALVELLRTAVDSDDQSAQEMVTHSLLNIAIGDDRNKATVVAGGGVPLLVTLLKPAQWREENKSSESQLKGITRTRVEASGEGGVSGSEGVRMSENVDIVPKSLLAQELKEVNEKIQRLEQKILRLEAEPKERVESLQATEAAALDSKNARAGNEAAVAALLTLSCLNENMACIGSSGAIPLLVQVLITGSNQGRKDALTTLYNLAISSDNRSRVVRAHAIPVLLHGLSLRKKDLSEKIVALLHILACIEEGRSAIADTENGIAVLAEILDTGSKKEREHAVAILLLLCTNSLQHSQLVMKFEGVIPALMSLSVGESNTRRAKNKALNLLAHFREQSEKQIILPAPFVRGFYKLFKKKQP